MAEPFTFDAGDHFVYTADGIQVPLTGTNLRNRGDWVADSFYLPFDAVRYFDSTFVAVLANSAQPPLSNLTDEWSHLTRVDLSIYAFGTQTFSLTRNFLVGRRV